MILDQVVARTELKDLRDHIEVRKVITPDELGAGLQRLPGRDVQYRP